MRRRTLLASACTALSGFPPAESKVTRPSIPESACSVRELSLKSPDGNEVFAIMRQPPGDGPFPVLVNIHGGLTPVAHSELRARSLTGPMPCRFLAAGYAIVIPTFRSRAVDPQTRDALVDCLTVVDYLKKSPSIDPKSVAVWGCSGGGSLVLEIASERALCGVVAEDPATVLFTGMMAGSTPKAKSTFSPSDSQALQSDPQKYYTPELRKFTQEKIRKISCPILIIHSKHPLFKLNSEIIIPELKAANKRVELVRYPDEGHCFAFNGDRSPEAAFKAFGDAEKFLLPLLATRPRPLPDSLVAKVPVTSTRQ
jgi:dipeptidyl aminopeptidase/acylaminoacyl peptidase